MKLIKLTLVGLCLATSSFIAHAQDAKIMPEKTRMALGGVGGVSGFNAQVALGRVAAADVSTQDKLVAAAKEAGGIGGGMGHVAKMLEDCMPHVPADDKEGLQSIIDLHKRIAEQADALVKLLTAKASKQGVEAAEKTFKESRAKGGAILAKMGFPAEMVK